MKPIYKLLSLFLIVQLPIGTLAQAPELSADEPIAYTADDGILIATGNAVYTDEDTRVEADQIQYNRNKDQIEATGNVRVTREGLRLLTSSLTYDAENKTVTAGHFRAGYPPLFMEGESFSGTLDQLDFSQVSLYFREPVQNSPKLKLENGTWTRGKSVTGSGLRLKALGGLSIPLPGFDYNFGAPTVDVSAKVGFRNNLGGYVQTRWLYPFSETLSAGGNLDLFTKRGVLVGPAFLWTREKGHIEAYFDSGWIHDHSFGERGVDILGDPIDQSRGFAGAGLRARDDRGELQFQARSTYLSDSEILRDFRRDDYFEQFQPDHFVDFTWQKENLILNLFARRQINDAYGLVERLPEIQVEWLPSQVAQTGLYVQAQASALRYRSVDVLPPQFSVLFPQNALGLSGPYDFTGFGIPELIESPYYDRLDGSLTLTKPIHLPAGVSLVLRGGGRWTQYQRNETDSLPSLTEDRWVGELGFDLSQSLSRTYHVSRPAWNMDRLRHVSRASVKYRWHPGGGDSFSAIPAFDRYAYHARRPALDLADLQHPDGLSEWNVARFGWENLLMVADENAPFRDFLSLNLYQDLLMSAEDGEDEWDAFYAEADLTPFPWLTVQWRHKVRPEAEETESSFFSATLRSADLWSLSLQAEYLQGAIEQYEIASRYRLTENLGLLAYWHYDSRLNTWTRQQYGFTRRFGNVWQLDLYIALNEENDRDDDFSVGMRLTWLAF